MLKERQSWFDRSTLVLQWNSWSRENFQPCRNLLILPTVFRMAAPLPGALSHEHVDVDFKPVQDGTGWRFYSWNALTHRPIWYSKGREKLQSWKIFFFFSLVYKGYRVNGCVTEWNQIYINKMNWLSTILLGPVPIVNLKRYYCSHLIITVSSSVSYQFRISLSSTAGKCICLYLVVK